MKFYYKCACGRVHEMGTGCGSFVERVEVVKSARKCCKTAALKETLRWWHEQGGYGEVCK